MSVLNFPTNHINLLAMPCCPKLTTLVWTRAAVNHPHTVSPPLVSEAVSMPSLVSSCIQGS